MLSVPGTIKKLIGLQALLSLAGAIGLMIWWFSMPVFLPVSDAAEHFQEMVLDPAWIPVNLVGLISVVLITLGFPAFWMKYHEKLKSPGIAGLIIASAGLILFTAIQYYETLLWPAAAGYAPDLVRSGGELVSGNTPVVAGLLGSGILLGTGYILFGVSVLKARVIPKIPVWLLLIGAPVFGNAIIFPLRTIGLVLFCTGTIWLSLKIRKS